MEKWQLVGSRLLHWVLTALEWLLTALKWVLIALLIDCAAEEWELLELLAKR